MAKKLLIAGIDIGLHTGLALLDLEGNLICLKTQDSAKTSELINLLMDYGNVIAISVDRQIPSKKVKKISSSLSAKLILPSKNMTKKKKRILVSKFLKNEKIRINSHERSALASAIFAYKRFKPRLKKLKDKLDKTKQMDKYEMVRDKIFTEKNFRMPKIS
jgi:predicted RNase H-like nuclease (RuvC/YqgF family)